VAVIEPQCWSAVNSYQLPSSTPCASHLRQHTRTLHALLLLARTLHALMLSARISYAVLSAARTSHAWENCAASSKLAVRLQLDRSRIKLWRSRACTRSTNSLVPGKDRLIGCWREAVRLRLQESTVEVRRDGTVKVQCNDSNQRKLRQQQACLRFTLSSLSLFLTYYLIASSFRADRYPLLLSAPAPTLALLPLPQPTSTKLLNMSSLNVRFTFYVTCVKDGQTRYYQASGVHEASQDTHSDATPPPTSTGVISIHSNLVRLL
jgi:hypothetical protein